MSVTTRAASLSDYAAYARLFPELGVDDPIPPENVFARMAPTTLFAEVDGDIAGCLVYQRMPPEGFVNQLIVGANWRAQGIGARLMHDAAKIMQAAGCETWALNVKQRNAPARIGSVSELDAVYTDQPPPGEFAARCRGWGVQLVVADQG